MESTDWVLLLLKKKQAINWGDAWQQGSAGPEAKVSGPE